MFTLNSSYTMPLFYCLLPNGLQDIQRRVKTFPPEPELDEFPFYPPSVRREKPHFRHNSTSCAYSLVIFIQVAPTDSRNRCINAGPKPSRNRNRRSQQTRSSVEHSATSIEPQDIPRNLNTYTYSTSDNESDRISKPGLWKRCMMCLLTDAEEVCHVI